MEINKILKLSAIFMVLVLCSNACTAEDAIVQVKLNVPTFIISQPANPTTGYQLTVQQYDKTILKLLKSEFVAPQSGLVGAGGVMKFTFALIGKSYPKTTQVVLRNARPWEKEAGTVRKITVRFISN